MPRSNRELLGEELLGAELLASRELVEGAGSIWDTMERTGRIQQRQIGLLVDDYRQFFSAIGTPDPLALPRATAQLALRRFNHISEGWRDFGEVLKDEVSPIGRAWSGFFEMVKQDWRR